MQPSNAFFKHFKDALQRCAVRPSNAAFKNFKDALQQGTVQPSSGQLRPQGPWPPECQRLPPVPLGSGEGRVGGKGTGPGSVGGQAQPHGGCEGWAGEEGHGLPAACGQVGEKEAAARQRQRLTVKVHPAMHAITGVMDRDVCVCV